MWMQNFVKEINMIFNLSLKKIAHFFRNDLKLALYLILFGFVPFLTANLPHSAQHHCPSDHARAQMAQASIE